MDYLPRDNSDSLLRVVSLQGFVVNQGVYDIHHVSPLLLESCGLRRAVIRVTSVVFFYFLSLSLSYLLTTNNNVSLKKSLNGSTKLTGNKPICGFH